MKIIRDNEVDTKGKPRQFDQARFILVYGIIIPLLLVAVGMIAAYLIPGCKIDEGSGASGCTLLAIDFGPLLELFVLGGFVWFMVCLLIFLYAIVPISILKGIIGLFKK